jgi:starch-binding outer membrane protein, SusD/RagB family
MWLTFIVDECDEIAEFLPVDYATFSSVQETGRATRGAAMALKSRVLLYAASPLHNPSEDAAAWEAAAAAAKALIDSAWYSLEPGYGNIVNNITSQELILGRREGESNGFERRNFPVGFEGGNTGTCPTQNLVDAYEMKGTGLPISDSASGFNPIFPYNGRDDRLGQTVILNNSIWKGKVMENYFGGANGAPRANATKTGYYLKKYVIEAIDLEPTNTTQRQHTWVLFRYGEILLNYAEAMNEVYGPADAAGKGMTALEAVNMVRQRAGMPDFPADLSQDDFRRKLRNERRVELAFEDHRFWDVRRWEIGAETTDIYAINIVRNPYGGFSYEKYLLETRVYEDRMNLYPISQAERYKNTNLEQNTGW